MTVRWSCCVVDPTGEIVHAEDAERVQPTASIGKLFLLTALAASVTEGTLDLASRVRRPADAVADSGLWQYLSIAELTLGDAAVLVGSVSDNLAANALLDALGTEAVDASAASLGCRESRLTDRIRDIRTPSDPLAPSLGRADELAEVARRIELSWPLVRTWLLSDVDLSMVGSAFGLDPLAHTQPDRGVTLWNKTGTDATVRADVGVVAGPGQWLAYAALAEWDITTPEDTSRHSDDRDAALSRMRQLGDTVRTLVGG